MCRPCTTLEIVSLLYVVYHCGYSWQQSLFAHEKSEAHVLGQTNLTHFTDLLR